MRSLSTILFLCTCLAGQTQQPAPSSNAFSGKLSIPAQLSKTVRADKVHAGDQVQFRTMMAVLVGNGLVMPANTTLYGRVLSAAPRQHDKNSYLAVVVERAEWKDHSLPLHAFIAAQLHMQPAPTPGAPDANSTSNQQINRRTGRSSGRAAVTADPSLGGLVRTPQDAAETAPAPAGNGYPMLKDVGFFRDKDGTTYLLSSKSNVELPAGVLVMLQNQPDGNSQNSRGKTADAATAVQP